MHIQALDGDKVKLVIVGAYWKKTSIANWLGGLDFYAPNYRNLSYFSIRNADTLKEMGFGSVVIDNVEVPL